MAGTREHLTDIKMECYDLYLVKCKINNATFWRVFLAPDSTTCGSFFFVGANGAGSAQPAISPQITQNQTLPTSDSLDHIEILGTSKKQDVMRQGGVTEILKNAKGHDDKSYVTEALSQLVRAGFVPSHILGEWMQKCKEASGVFPSSPAKSSGASKSSQVSGASGKPLAEKRVVPSAGPGSSQLAKPLAVRLTVAHSGQQAPPTAGRGLPSALKHAPPSRSGFPSLGRSSSGDARPAAEGVDSTRGKPSLRPGGQSFGGDQPTLTGAAASPGSPAARQWSSTSDDSPRSSPQAGRAKSSTRTVSRPSAAPSPTTGGSSLPAGRLPAPKTARGDSTIPASVSPSPPREFAPWQAKRSPSLGTGPSRGASQKRERSSTPTAASGGGPSLKRERSSTPLAVGGSSPLAHRSRSVTPAVFFQPEPAQLPPPLEDPAPINDDESSPSGTPPVQIQPRKKAPGAPRKSRGSSEGPAQGGVPGFGNA